MDPWHRCSIFVMSYEVYFEIYNKNPLKFTWKLTLLLLLFKWIIKINEKNHENIAIMVIVTDCLNVRRRKINDTYNKDSIKSLLMYHFFIGTNKWDIKGKKKVTNTIWAYNTWQKVIGCWSKVSRANINIGIEPKNAALTHWIKSNQLVVLKETQLVSNSVEVFS